MSIKSLNTKTPILEKISRQPLIFDGAMGTMIYQRGIFINACYDELCITKPALIQSIHQEYINAGVDVIETNTFSANRIKLASYGLADRAREINLAAAKIARQVAGDLVYVAGSVGPCSKTGATPDRSSRSEQLEAYTEQISALVEGGVDLILLETFFDIESLRLALEAAALHKIPVMASFTVPEAEIDAENLSEINLAKLLDEDPRVSIIGINCGVGPQKLLLPIQRIVKAVKKPVIAMPNAGGPSEVGGRQMYLNSPEFFSEYCKKYIELGARGIGGCCGTTPGHLAMAARAVRCLSGVKEHIEIISAPSQATPEKALPQLTPTQDKSPFAKKLYSGKMVTSIEILPPQNGKMLPGFIGKCRQCQEAGIDAINLPDGPRASARVSVIATALAMKRELTIEPIPHYCCRDRNLIGMQSDLLGGYALGLNNWLFITGDPPKLGHYPNATGVYDVDAIGLCQMVSNLNSGMDAAGESIGDHTVMLMGVGSNPVALEMEREIDRFFKKIDAGAEYTITQPVFDPEALFRFIDRVSKYHKTIPLIAGIYPLVSFKNADFMSKHVPGVVVPDRILERMSMCKTKEDGIKAGIEIAHETCEAVKRHVQGIQMSAPLGNIQSVLTMMKELM